jgi:hypothetical protein
MKSEIRDPKSEALQPARPPVTLRASDFGLRISDFRLWWFVLLASAAAAQNAPRIGYTYPAGGQVGTSFVVKVGGQFLDGVTNAHFSGPDLEATVLEHFKPITQQQFNNLRERMQELQKERKTPAVQRELAEIRAKLATFNPRPANPAIVEHALLRVTIAPNASPGRRELRLGTPTGLSNPLVFQVGQLPEFRKTETKADPADNRPFRQNPEQWSAVEPTETRISLPATVNGQMLRGGVDRFRFPARKGQSLVAAVSARELMPYLADAVPGWFQATLTLRDAAGRELAYDDDFQFHPDPVLHFTIPKDGEYVLEIKDAIYRGREDFVYRLSVGELPFLTGLFPLGGRLGEATTVELLGWNLPLTKLQHANEAAGLDFISVTNGGYVSNRRPFAVEDWPETLEAEPNDLRNRAERVTLPVTVNGRIGRPGDVDCFRFEGRAGEEVVAEITARRLESPLDSVLRLFDAAGQQLAVNDDTEDKAAGLNTHHADSYLRVTLPADGAYVLQLGDTQRKGGPEYAYRLRLSAPRPDFALRIAPSTVSLRAGGSVSLTAYAVRRDGFTNEISLALSHAPAGFKLSGARIPAGAEQVKFTLTAPLNPLDTPATLAFEGRAMIRGEPVTRPAAPADDLMQAFAYHHLVVADEFRAAVGGRFAPRAAIRVLSATPVKIPVGGLARVKFEIPPGRFADRLQLELLDPPEGLSVKEYTVVRDVAELTLQSDGQKSKPGQKGNLVVNVSAARPNDPKAKAPGRQRGPVVTLPAVPFETVARE